MLSLSATAAMTGGPRKNFIEGFSKTWHSPKSVDI
jgi:hypothetical protein